MRPEDANKSLLYTLPKKERLSSKLLIAELITSGASYYVYPIKCYYSSHECSSNDFYHTMAVLVPKRSFKSAVKRNRIKRLLREAYRLNKILLCSTQKQYDMLFLYVAKEVLPYQKIEHSIIEILHFLQQQD